MTKSSKDQNKALDLDRVAANGLLSRRHLLSAALGGAGLAMAGPVIGQEPGIKLEILPGQKTPGRVPARTAAVLHMPDGTTVRIWQSALPGRRRIPFSPAAPTGHHYAEQSAFRTPSCRHSGNRSCWS